MGHEGGSGFDEAYYQGNAQSGDRIALAFYARVAARLAEPGAAVLEYGSGMGHLSRRLAQRREAQPHLTVEDRPLDGLSAADLNRRRTGRRILPHDPVLPAATPIRVPPTAPRRLACSAHWSLPPISTPSVRAGIPWFLAALHVGRSSAFICLIGWVDRPRSRLGSTCRHLGQPGQPTGQK